MSVCFMSVHRHEYDMAQKWRSEENFPELVFQQWDLGVELSSSDLGSKHHRALSQAQYSHSWESGVSLASADTHVRSWDTAGEVNLAPPTSVH